MENLQHLHQSMLPVWMILDFIHLDTFTSFYLRSKDGTHELCFVGLHPTELNSTGLHNLTRLNHSTSLPLCLFVSMSLCHYSSMSLCLYVSLSPCLYVSESLCHYLSMSLRLSVTMSPCLYVSLSLCFHVSMSLCFDVSLSPCLYVSMSVYLYVSLTLCHSASPPAVRCAVSVASVVVGLLCRLPSMSRLVQGTCQHSAIPKLKARCRADMQRLHLSDYQRSTRFFYFVRILQYL